MWGIRVVVPEKLRGRVLDELHQSHAGIVKTKSLARSYVWWPGLDAQIENLTMSCETAKQHEVHPWWLHSTPGHGQRSPGSISTLDHSTIVCF